MSDPATGLCSQVTQKLKAESTSYDSYGHVETADRLQPCFSGITMISLRSITSTNFEVTVYLADNNHLIKPIKFNH